MIYQLKILPLGGSRLVKFIPQYVQRASITGRGTRGGPLVLSKKPFPYNEKRYTALHKWLDNTIIRVSEENAKIIVVEGPIGVGKSGFAKTLAEQFDMHHIPQPSMDYFYVLPTGLDLRQYDHKLPKSMQSFDYKNLCVDPTSIKTCNFLYKMLFLKFLQYVDALCHLMNTGQGVVLERSYYSDYVFMKAMYEQKFISKEVRDMYAEVLKNTSTFFLSPHLVIYLDISVPVVQERIRTRNYSYEQNSPLLTKGFLESLEKYWKQDYLIRASKTSEVLIYDWTDGGDVDVVIDDIEKIDFNPLRRDNRFEQWQIPRTRLNILRSDYTNNVRKYFKYFQFRDYNVPGMSVNVNDALQLDLIMCTIPDVKFDRGYNYLMGDSIFKILFKSNREYHRDLRPYLMYYDYANDFL